MEKLNSELDLKLSDPLYYERNSFKMDNLKSTLKGLQGSVIKNKKKLSFMGNIDFDEFEVFGIHKLALDKEPGNDEGPAKKYAGDLILREIALFSGAF